MEYLRRIIRQIRRLLFRVYLVQSLPLTLNSTFVSLKLDDKFVFVFKEFVDKVRY